MTIEDELAIYRCTEEYDAGYKACKDGLKITDNPYDEDISYASSWAWWEGYMEAKLFEDD